MIINAASWPKFDDMTNVNKLWNEWKATFTGVADQAAPKKSLRVRNNSHAWINSDIRNLMAKRDRINGKFISLKKRSAQCDLE